MARLINPGLGDYLDRLAILELKIQHAPEDRADHFRREKAAVLTKIQGSSQVGFPIEEYTALCVVNARIWRDEDKMADFAATTATDLDLRTAADAGYLGIDIWRLNRLRGKTVEAINAKVGDDRGQEKL